MHLPQHQSFRSEVSVQTPRQAFQNTAGSLLFSMAMIDFVRRRRPFLIFNPPPGYASVLTSVPAHSNMRWLWHMQDRAPQSMESIVSQPGTCTAGSTMRLYQEPLSPQGIHCERKLVEAWKPTCIIIRLLGQQLTNNISR